MNKNTLIVGSLAIVLGAGSYWFNTKAVAVTVVVAFVVAFVGASAFAWKASPTASLTSTNAK